MHERNTEQKRSKKNFQWLQGDRNKPGSALHRRARGRSPYITLYNWTGGSQDWQVVRCHIPKMPAPVPIDSPLALQHAQQRFLMLRFLEGKRWNGRSLQDPSSWNVIDCIMFIIFDFFSSKLLQLTGMFGDGSGTRGSHNPIKVY